MAYFQRQNLLRGQPRSRNARCRFATALRATRIFTTGSTPLEVWPSMLLNPDINFANIFEAKRFARQGMWLFATRASRVISVLSYTMNRACREHGKIDTGFNFRNRHSSRSKVFQCFLLI